MAKILDMPKLSPTMEEGVLLAWHKNEGDAVGVDDLLAEVETDKATMEFRAFDKGTLLKILAPAGTTVKLGQAVAILGNAGEDVSALVAKAGGGAQAQPAQAQGEQAKPKEKEAHLAEPESRPLSMMRKTIARRLTESKQTVPHFYLTIDVDAEQLVHLRETINEELANDHAPTKSKDGEEAKPFKISVNDLLVKAC